MAEKTDSQKRAQKNYMQKFARIEIRVTHEMQSDIKECASHHDESINAFIVRAITETMERDKQNQ